MAVTDHDGARTQVAPQLAPAQHDQGCAREPEPGLTTEAPGLRLRRLEDRVALITGGDSGIGRAVAVLFAREGADVGIVYRDDHADAELTRMAVEASGRRAVLLRGDVRDPAFCRRAVQEVLREFGHLHILVNHAAVTHRVDEVDDLDGEPCDHAAQTSIYGYFHMAHAAIPHLQRGATILNTGSIPTAGRSPLDHAASRGAIHAFTRSLAQTLADRGIRVNCVVPGPVRTTAQPEEIAPALVFLASSGCASSVTGAVVPIPGGHALG